MDERLCLLSVHAHPDDEASKGAGTVHRYHDEGVHTVLVCCTGGEAGDILNPAMDRPEVRARLHDVRMEELRRATEIIGYDEVVMLGYRDSGMPGTPENEDPRAFARADLDEAVGLLVAGLRHPDGPRVAVLVRASRRGRPSGLSHRGLHPGSFPGRHRGARGRSVRGAAGYDPPDGPVRRSAWRSTCRRNGWTRARSWRRSSPSGPGRRRACSTSSPAPPRGT